MVLPLTLTFFKTEIESIQVKPAIRATEYLSMSITTLMGFGLVFELPVLSFFLARVGVIDHRFLIDWFKHAVIAIFIVSAVLTPPDVLSQFLMAGPLMVLYGISIGVAYISARKNADPNDEPRTEQPGPPPPTTGPL
jgi:sec-independent protein translocase protein TatC